MATLKHYFVVNPVSGKNATIDYVNDLIIPACEKAGVDYEIYTTTAAGDGIRFVDETAAAAGNKPVRFYAVGGDGTLYEVVNGAFGHPNAEVGVIPKGSGNDWIRLFGDLELFRNMEAQLSGKAYPVDCIKANDVVAINQSSMGYDAEVTARQASMKKVPGAVGHMTYLLAGLTAMFTHVWFDFKVTIDGQEIRGPFIQCVGANSRWYGSGIKVAPFAMPDDHMLDFVIFRRTSSWLSMVYPIAVNWQMKGDHTKYSFVEYYRGKKMVIETKKPSHTNIDGEVQFVDKLTLELVENGINFVIPEGSDFFENKARGILNNGVKKSLRNKAPLKYIFAEYNPYSMIVNKGIKRLTSMDRNYLNYSRLKNRRSGL